MRLAVVRDFRAEGWPSMDLCADQLLDHLPAAIVAEDVAPDFRHVFGRLPFLRRAGFNADRLLNRHLLLPGVVRGAARRAGFVHVVDHSYAHVISASPSGTRGSTVTTSMPFDQFCNPRTSPGRGGFASLRGGLSMD